MYSYTGTLTAIQSTEMSYRNRCWPVGSLAIWWTGRRMRWSGGLSSEKRIVLAYKTAVSKFLNFGSVR